MTYTYHYQAIDEDDISLDGILTLNVPIKTMEDYQMIKDILYKKFDVDRDSLRINSLSLLGAV